MDAKSFGSRSLCGLLLLSLLTLQSCAPARLQSNIIEEQGSSEEDGPVGEATPEAKAVFEAEMSRVHLMDGPPDSGGRDGEEEWVWPDDLKAISEIRTVPQDLLKRSFQFFVRYRNQFKNQNYVAMIDFRQKNSLKRFYIVDIRTAKVESYLVAHGKNSDPNFDGLATQFSNVDGSLMSSLGAYMTAETYSGKHGYSLRLDGLESSNSAARSRAIVVHGADYVSPDRDPIGRSFGCPAVENSVRTKVIDQLKGGALIYAYWGRVDSKTLR